jgi:hypothetical protein
MKQGLIGETRRVIHSVPVPDHGLTGLYVTHCGEQFRPAEVDRLNAFDGMPCEGCMIRAAITNEPAAIESHPYGAHALRELHSNEASPSVQADGALFVC